MTLSPIQLIVFDKEHDRILERMKLINRSYADHQTWSKKDIQDFKELKARRDELRKLMGIKY